MGHVHPWDDTRFLHIFLGHSVFYDTLRLEWQQYIRRDNSHIYPVPRQLRIHIAFLRGLQPVEWPPREGPGHGFQPHSLCALGHFVPDFLPNLRDVRTHVHFRSVYEHVR